jgi:hypothetical protein
MAVIDWEGWGEGGGGVGARLNSAHETMNSAPTIGRTMSNPPYS